MTPRPHLAFSFGSEIRKPPFVVGPPRDSTLSSLRQAMNSVAVGKWSESWQGDRSWLGRSGHMSVTLLLGIEGLVFLAILLVVLRSSTDVGQSVWLLSGLSLAVLVLSWLRRRALSTW